MDNIEEDDNELKIVVFVKLVSFSLFLLSAMTFD